MEQKVYAVFDSKVSAYMNFFQAQSDGQAIRSFTKAAIEEGHDFNQFPGDYTLFRLGTWYPDKGVIEMEEARVNLGTALTFQTSYRAQVMALEEVA